MKLGSSNLRKLLEIVPSKVKKKSLLVLLLSFFGSLLDILLVICVIPLIRFLQDPKRESEIFGQFFESAGIKSVESFTIIEFSIFMFCVALIGSLIKLIFYRSSAFLSAEASNTIIKSTFSSRLNSPKIILEKDRKSSFFSMLHKIDIISNTYFIMLSASASVMLIICTVTLLLFLNPLVTFLVSIITLFLYYVVYFSTKNPINDASNSINENADLRSKAILNSLSSVREAILYNKVGYFMREVEQKDSLFRRSRANIQFFGQLPRAIFESLTIIIVLMLCLLLRGSSVEANMEILPLLGAFLLAFQRMLPQFQTIYGSYNEFRGALDIINSFYDDHVDLKTKRNPDQSNKEIIDKTRETDGFNSFEKISLKDLSFKYPEASENVLSNINFEIEKNSKIAIIGPSGSGKSTLVDLILGLHHPTSGEIFVDKSKINKNNLSSYRTLFSYVPQRIGILNKSIIDNVTLQENTSDFEKEAIEAIYKSQLFKPDQKFDIHEEIGEGGESISGGQAQRLAIARMYFFSKKVVIFDESTSSLDSSIESEILEEVTSIKDITFIHITHRLKKDYYDKVYEISSSGIKEIEN